MKNFRVTGTATIYIVTMVSAKDYEEALEIASDREINICIHGSELAEGCVSDSDFIPVDACAENMPENLDAEEE